MSSEKVWWVVRNETRTGPLSTADLQLLIDEKSVAPTDLVWKEGLSEWVQIAGIGEFTFAVQEQPKISFNIFSGKDGVLAGEAGARESLQLQEIEDYRHFVGKKYDTYYRAKWRGEVETLKQSWNWAAFFFTFIWLAYRKMYLFALAGGFVYVLFASLIERYSPRAPIFMGFGLAGVFLLYANGFYKRYVDKKISETRAAFGSGGASRVKDSLVARGGVNIWGGALYAISFVSLGVVLSPDFDSILPVENPPLCSSTQATSTLTTAYDKSPYARTENLSVVEISNVRSLAYDSGGRVRSCSARITLNNNTSINVSYKMAARENNKFFLDFQQTE